MALSREKCLYGIPLTTCEAHQRHGHQRDAHRRWARRSVWVWSMVLLGLLLQSSVGGCGRKGPPNRYGNKPPVNAQLKLVSVVSAVEGSGAERRTGN